MEGGAGFLKRISHQMSIFRNFFSQIFAKVDACLRSSRCISCRKKILWRNEEKKI
jgi:hypothetical protein